MVCHGHAEFKMPRNYVASDDYPMLEKEEVEARLTEAYKQIDVVASDILSGNDLAARRVTIFETLITVPFNPVWCKFKLKAKDFHVENTCADCGKCAKLCPLNNIKLVDKKPIWENNCTHCMACIANCPVNAIQYGKITQSKERYNFGKYRYVIKNIKADEDK